MKEVKKELLMEVHGGTELSASLLNATVKALGIVLDVGRSLGSTIRMAITNTKCPL